MDCKITVMRKAHYEDLIERFENPLDCPCDMELGRVFRSNGGEMPEGLCESAWETMRPFVEALARGEGDFYDGWMKDPRSAMISCNDGFRPVSFYIEAIPGTESTDSVYRMLDGAEDWSYTELSDGTLRLMSYDGNSVLEGAIAIPSEYKGKPVTELGGRLFCECKHITAVELPETIRAIGDAAFAICNSLTEINFPAGLSEIPADCFNECGFTELMIPDTVQRIRRGAFINCRQLKQVTLPSGLKEVELMTFSGCAELAEVSLPKGLTDIADGAFSSCAALQHIELPDTLESIGMMAFLSCNQLEEVSIPAGVTRIGNIAFSDKTTLIRN